jgi:anti-sigma-K factor RskA
MKPAKNIEEFVRLEKPHVTTGSAMDKRTLNESFAAMAETIRANKPGTAGIFLRSRSVKLAAAAVILLAVGLLMVYRNPPVQQPPQTVNVAKSPAEMLTAMSLNIAWRRGGIEAVDDQSEEAFRTLGSQPAKASIQELLVELNGV